MEFNKIFAALLVALLLAMLAILISEEMMEPQKLAKNIFIIEAAEEASGATNENAKEKLDPIAPLLVKASAENGEKLASKLCAQCHTFKSGEANKTGPNLFGVIGSTFAHIAGFAYSKVFQEKRDKDHWDEEKVNIYLYQPKSLMPGTKMAFAGIKKSSDRADVIKFLTTLK